LAPAAGRWQPEDDALASLDGGYVETNVPAVCFMNFNGSSVWTGSTGDEMAIAGSTPVEIKAEIKIDASGLARRRDVDGLSSSVPKFEPIVVPDVVNGGLIKDVEPWVYKKFSPFDIFYSRFGISATTSILSFAILCYINPVFVHSLIRVLS